MSILFFKFTLWKLWQILRIMVEQTNFKRDWRPSISTNATSSPEKIKDKIYYYIYYIIIYILIIIYQDFGYCQLNPLVCINAQWQTLPICMRI